MYIAWFHNSHDSSQTDVHTKTNKQKNTWIDLLFFFFTFALALSLAVHCIALHCIAHHCIPLHTIVYHCIPLHAIACHCIHTHVSPVALYTCSLWHVHCLSNRKTVCVKEYKYVVRRTMREYMRICVYTCICVYVYMRICVYAEPMGNPHLSQGWCTQYLYTYVFVFWMI